MTVIGTATALIDQNELAVPLPRYAQLIEYNECPFFGVNQDVVEYACRDIWTLPQRVVVAEALAEAQVEIEDELGFPLSIRWFAGERHKIERSGIVFAEWQNVIEPGVRAESDISLGEAVNLAADPATVGPVATAVTDEAEIRICHPGTDIEIFPSSIEIAAGNVTIEIPKCRMVKESLHNNPSGGLTYENATFEATVDVKRVYNDPSTNATLIWPHKCSDSCAASNCSEYTQTACMLVRLSEPGTFDLRPATYSSGSWSGTTPCFSSVPKYAEINYRAGIDSTHHQWRQIEQAVIRLAHSKMSQQPCGCDEAIRKWKRDRNVPGVLTRERINCPFGLSDGAWQAWMFVSNMRQYRMAVL